jgi:hypothetical protein
MYIYIYIYIYIYTHIYTYSYIYIYIYICKYICVNEYMYVIEGVCIHISAYDVIHDTRYRMHDMTYHTACTTQGMIGNVSYFSIVRTYDCVWGSE